MEATVTLERMSEAEARACVDQIKSNLETVRARLFELREREGWRALGYLSLGECIQAEFTMSESQAHRLINAHIVDRTLAPPWQEASAFFGKNATTGGSPLGEPERFAEIPERHARELAPLIPQPEALREVYAEVQERAGPAPTAADYREAVERRLGHEPTATFVVPEMEHESEEERAYYALTRQRLVVRFDPWTVADAATRPDAALPGFEELEAWFSSFMARLRANAASPVRAVQ